MKKILLITSLLILCVKLAYSEDSGQAVLRKELSFDPLKDADKITAYLDKYGIKDINPGDEFYEEYTSTLLCAHDNENKDQIKALIYFGGTIKEHIKFSCDILEIGDKRFFLWIGELPLSKKIIVAVTQPSERDYKIGHVEKITGTEIAESMKPIDNANPSDKYKGDKIVTQTSFDCEIATIQNKQLVVDKSKLVANISIQTKEGKNLSIVFDPASKSLSKIEVK